MELFLNSDSRIKTCSSNFCDKANAVWDFKVHQNIPASLSGKGLFSSVSIWTIPENAFLNNVSLYISMVFGILAAVSTTSSCFASGLVNSFVFIHLSVLKAPTHELFCVILEGFFSKRRFYDIVYACCIWLILPFCHNQFLFFMYLSFIHYFCNSTLYTRGVFFNAGNAFFL